MTYDQDFRKIIYEGSILVSIEVLYVIPDTSLLNTFFWQTLDIVPQYPRIKRFLRYWETNIDARIKEVIISGSKHMPIVQWKNGVILSLD